MIKDEKTSKINLRLTEYQLEILLEALEFHGSEVVPNIVDQIKTQDILNEMGI